MIDPQRAPYGRGGKRREEEAPRRYEGETYYGRPALKPSYYKWLIAWYFLLGGISGGAGVLAAVGEWVGRGREETMVRVARYVALVTILISPILLIKDIHTPQRFYNMLRIFRRTSPLSIGTWTATFYGALVGLTALGQGASDFAHLAWGRRLARALTLPVALVGSLMTTYTAIVLSATSVPLWVALSRHLPVLFASAATSTTTATLSLILGFISGTERTQERLEKLALVATGTELAALVATERHLRATGMNQPLQEPKIAPAYRFGVWGLGLLLPLTIHLAQLASGRHSRAASLLASVATLVGGLTLRAVLLFAGNRSALVPELYFTLTNDGEGEGEKGRGGDNGNDEKRGRER